MDKLKTTLLLLAMCFTFALSVASDKQPPNKPKNDTGKGYLFTLRQDSNRKRMPSCNILELTYENGCLTLESETTEGSFSLQIENIEEGYSEYVPTISVGETVAIDLDCGQYNVSATSTEGILYTGDMLIL